jgi:hypothetical protein
MRRVLGGTLAGLSSTLIMEYAASFLYERESEDAPRAEERGRQDAAAAAHAVYGLPGGPPAATGAPQLHPSRPFDWLTATGR